MEPDPPPNSGSRKEDSRAAPGPSIPEDSTLPASCVAGEAAALLAAGGITPPTCPGQLGNLDRFALVRLLGTGGMGMVFLARDTAAGAFVAVKLPRPEFRQEARIRRFLGEVRLQQQLKHPNILPVLEVNKKGESFYFVMPYLEGGSLAGRLQARQPLPAKTILDLLLPVADALATAHPRGIIHRDIKPGNILIDKDGSPRLADFGLARAIYDPVENPDQDHAEGTGPYMSPAVAAGEAEDTRCDIYAFGALLYHLRSGLPPYFGEAQQTVRQQILAGPPKAIRELNPSADSNLTQVAEWAMALEQRDRYANIADLAADLRRISQGKPPRGPHQFARRIRRPLPNLRGPRAKALGLASAIVVLGAVLYLAWPRLALCKIAEFTSPHVTSWVQAQLAQWDGDTCKALLVTDHNDLMSFSHEGHLLSTWECDDPAAKDFQLRMTARLPSDRFDKAYVSWDHGTNLFLAAITPDSAKLREFTAQGREAEPRNPGATTSLTGLQLLPGKETRNHRPQLIALLATGYGGGPRGLCCFDYQTAHLNWSYPCGPSIFSCDPIDLDGDGFADIVCGTSSPDNNYTGPDGLDDAHAGVIAISDQGNQLWHHTLAGAQAGVQCFPLDADNDGKTEILACVTTGIETHRQHGPEQERMVLLDRKGDFLNQFRADACLRSCRVTALGGTNRILCTDCEGFLYVLDAGLRLCRRKIPIARATPAELGKFGRLEVRVLGTPHLFGSRKQILLDSKVQWQDTRDNLGTKTREPDLLLTSKERIIVLDSNLKRIDQISVTGPFSTRFADMDGDGLDEIIVLTDRASIWKLNRKSW